MTTHRISITSALAATTLLLATSAQAGSYVSGSWHTGYDDSTREHFAGSVEDYNGTANSNLNHCHAGIEDLRGHLNNIGYGNYRIFTDEDVWSTAYESGVDWIYADGGDLAYFSGHGGSGLFVMNGDAGDDMVWWDEVRWGDRDLEVIAFDACRVLDANGRSQLGSANAYDGVHWMLGFESNARDVSTTASHYGYYLRMGYSIGSAWQSATRDGHFHWSTAAYVRYTSSSCNTAYDTATSMSCDPSSGVTTASARWSL
jgi:hypothetical protein